MLIKNFGLPLNLFSLIKKISTENIVLSENGALIKDEEEAANIFDNYFVNIVPNLGIKLNMNFLTPLIIHKI